MKLNYIDILSIFPRHCKKANGTLSNNESRFFTSDLSKLFSVEKYPDLFSSAQLKLVQ